MVKDCAADDGRFVGFYGLTDMPFDTIIFLMGKIGIRFFAPTPIHNELKRGKNSYFKYVFEWFLKFFLHSGSPLGTPLHSKNFQKTNSALSCQNGLFFHVLSHCAMYSYMDDCSDFVNEKIMLIPFILRIQTIQ